MKGILRTLGGTLIVLLGVSVIIGLIVLSVVFPVVFGLIIIGVLIIFAGWLIGWFVWGQGPPKV